MKKIAKIIIYFTDRISSRLLDNPTMFNYVRFLLAGKQKKMKIFIKKYLDQYECGTVADICSGTGDFAELVSREAKYVGFDLNSDFINFARKRYLNDKNKKFVKVNVLTSKAIQKSKFDAVMLISALHHFSDDDLKILLQTVKKMTKKVVIIADIIPDPPHLIQKFFARIDRGKFVRTAPDKLKILSKYFKVVTIIPIPTGSAVQLGVICVRR